METGSVRHLIEPYTDGALRFAADPLETLILMQSKFQPFEGEIDSSRHLRIGLNIGTTQWLYRHGEVGVIDCAWRRNGITVSLPNEKAHGRSPPVSMIGMAIDLDQLSADLDTPVSAQDFEPLAAQITMDAVAARQLRALLAGADLHGLSSAYFSEGIGALLHRLATGRAIDAGTGVYPLDARRLKTVLELMDANLGNDLTVLTMARAVDMDATNFAKAFRAATGLAPFAHMTRQRMKLACDLLASGHSVTSVALSVNYANPSKFAAAFKRCLGCTPTEWMAANNG
ncbi:MAG: AraC family transcriptional regulator [Hyphomonadaceae bacterium]|nr:AraC family transcriptional regulator [Hyphomonadaceae bacterium]